MPRDNRIRPYDGPKTEHRYRTWIDKWVHLLSLEDPEEADAEEILDDEAGDSDGPIGWNGLLLGVDPDDLEEIAQAEDGLSLTDAEREFIDAQRGAIVTEGRSGAVKVTYCEQVDELKDAWESIIARDPGYDGNGFPGGALASVDAEEAEEILEDPDADPGEEE